MKYLAVLLLCSTAFAQKGTFTTYSTVWNNLPRTYSIYVPPIVQPNPALVMSLHQTQNGQQLNPPLTVCTKGQGWDKIADLYGFIVLCPVSTWKAFGTSGAYFWQAYSTDSFFPVDPDDSGFLASLITMMESSYAVDPKRVFVVGMSSGAMMTHRMCIDHADLIAACAPVSGPVWVGSATSNLPSQPVSIMEYHGDADPMIKYCGGPFAAWGEPAMTIPSVDTDVNYWLAADGLPANPVPLCSGGIPNPAAFSVAVQSPDGRVGVEFVRRLGGGHTYGQDASPAIWEFFSTHGR